MPLPKERMREYFKERYHRRRNLWLDKLGGKCVKCGSTENLEFDHIIREDKEYTINSCFQSRSDKILEYELAKCQLLCEACHKIKSDDEMTLKGDDIRHGIGWTYTKRKCRCDECVAWQRQRSVRLKGI